MRTHETLKKVVRFGSIVAALLLCGCTTRFIDYTILSTKNVDLSKASTFKRGPNRITGEDSQMIIIFIPTSGAPNVKEAADRAIESVPGAVALIDGVVSFRNWWFIVGESAYVVEGTPLIDPSIPGASASLNADRMVSFYNPKAKKQIAKSVDKDTYQKVKLLAQRHADKELSHLLLALP